jgi:hypothetical protein
VIGCWRNYVIVNPSHWGNYLIADTVPWVEGEAGAAQDSGPMILTALQSLHGFTMACHPATPHLVHHGPPRTYLRTIEDIRAELARWEARCAEYDREPHAWRAKQSELAELAHAYVAAERRRRAAQAK